MMAEVMEKNVGGRPLKYAPDDFSKRINRYFNSISYYEEVLNDAGEPAIDIDGEKIIKVVYATPPSILGMCLSIGINRETLLEYSNREQFADTIKQAKAKVEQYLADQLNRTTQVAGIIFNLKNNFGWKDVQTVENTGPNGGPLLIQGVSAMSDADLRLMAEIMERSQITGEVVDITPEDDK